MLATTEGVAAKPHIFISYATLDQAKALRIVDTLERFGHACWIAPRDIPAGHDFQAEIVIAIESAAAVVMLLSKNAALSTEIPKEILVARTSNRLIMPLRLDDAELGAAQRYQLINAQWIDFSKDFDAGLKELGDRITRQLDPARAAAEAARRNRRRSPKGVVPALVFAALALVTFFAWPVLRPSVETLIAARTPQPSPVAVLPPAPARMVPPPADTIEMRVQALVESYYRALSGPPGRALDFLQQKVADPVEFYGRSTPRRVIVAQEGAYLQRWPDRQFSIEPGSLQVSCAPSRCSASGLLDYTMRSAARHAVSAGTERFDMQVGTGPLDFLGISTIAVERRSNQPP